MPAVTEKELTQEQKDQLDSLYAEAYRDYPTYARTFLKIQTKEGQKINYDFNEIQVLLQEIVVDMLQTLGFVRAYILKARQEGVSTYFTGRFFWKVTTGANRHAAIVTHEPEATETLHNMCKRYYDNLPPDMKPAFKYNSKKLLEFNTKDGKGLDSAIRVGTAGKADFGSSQMLHYLHLSEVSKWPVENQKDLLRSLLPCVPTEQDTAIVFESTAKGIGGEFYTGFWACKYIYEIYLKDGVPAWKKRVNPDAKPGNKYSSIFIPWYVFKKYEMEPEPDFKRTKEEEDLAKTYGLTDRKLTWRRDCIANTCQGSEDTFKQEYPSNAYEAFLSSGRPFFNPASKLRALMEAAKPPIARYNIFMSNGSCIADKEGKLQVWQEPIKGRGYIVSADVAEGLEHGDFDSVDVIDQLTGIQVAHWHGHMLPDLFGMLLIWIARRYNMAWIVPERNNHGLLTVTKISDLRYPRLYVETIQEPPHLPRRRFGWHTTKSNKFPICDNLSSEFSQNTHGINCRETFEEMVSFKQKDDGTLGAEAGMCDDRVMCYDENTEVLTSEGWSKFKNVKTGGTIPSLNLQTGKVEQAINLQTISSKYSGEMVHFKGRSIDLLVTPNHNMVAASSLGGNQYKPFTFIQASHLLGKHFRLKQDAQWQGEIKETWNIPPINNSKGVTPHHKIVNRDVFYTTLQCNYCDKQFSVLNSRIEKYGNGLFCSYSCKGVATRKGDGKWSSYNKPEKTVEINSFLEFIGFYISEGSGNENRLNIAQKQKSKGWEPIKRCLDKLGFNYITYNNGFWINDTQLCTYIKSLVPGNCYQKRIPRNILDLDKQHLQHIYTAMMLGDGYFKGNGGVYITTSKGLRDDFVEMVAKLGGACTVNEVSPNTKTIIRGRQVKSQSPCYVISINFSQINPRFNHHRDYKHGAICETVQYDGFIYCLYLEKNHTLYVRRNGRVCWSGNSFAIGKYVRTRVPLLSETQPQQTQQYDPAQFNSPQEQAQYVDFGGHI